MKINRLTAYLSHWPGLYALVVGFGVVLFWRGVWHTIDQIHSYATYEEISGTINAYMSPWWDGPLSLVVGTLILYFTGAFVSSFIGNELILSGLRGEKRLNERTEEEIRNEVRAIADIKDSVREINRNLEQLEKKVLEHHNENKS